ncbi:coiled-coil domain-containing protein [Hespellia stercorisuis]|uniref:N-terminal domain of peptidoglycan hydrolase CwlO-containing protein n=1 Tax=Hespellia stercorisuis DSM 15480 TaxID=1121950 RepID=A0A1M6PJE0_9FIRM|nr:NlpC/P60 family protein [Hespellia stercorisuis]SHK08053.1 N-terminal domain of peptidoglycan hydrolase CwlO-containing protein [Hespellia stercorisuis DSM 15480]
MKRSIVRGLVAVVVTSSLIATPVFATDATTGSLESQKAAAQSQVSDLQTQLNTIIGNLNDLEIQGQQKADQIAQAQTELEQTQQKEAEQYESMKLRIKYMYEDGNTTAIENIISSGSFTEMLEQVEYANSISTYDRNALNEYHETVQQVSDMKSTLEDEQAQLEEMETEYQAQSEELNTMITEKSAEVSNLDGMIQAAAAKAAAEAAAKAAAAQAAAATQVASAQTTTAQTGAGQAAATQPTADTPAAATPAGETPAPEAPTPEAPVAETPVDDGGSYNPTPEPSYDGATGNAIVDRAYGWVNNAEYVWGACSPGAFDCSGFVSYCLTGAYSRLGTTYTFLGWQQVSDPQPGDVAVNANHCGIYIGGGQMIHAATEGVGVIVGPVQGGMIFVRY